MLSDQDAEDCFKIYSSLDPFPKIPPSLLNSADVWDYVLTTGMLCPFYPDELKPASYEIRLLGECVYWDEKSNQQTIHLKENDTFVLKPNSIAFVTLEPYFRVPDYIALRFNLKITHIYRGLLLGTGPLVDPGFHGKLSIPLHNLTTNEYEFKGGEGLIWMEFTKLSSHSQWKNPRTSAVTSRVGKYVSFPRTKNLKSVKAYLAKASPHKAIKSSISDAVISARDSSRQAAQNSKIVTLGGILAIAAFTVSVILPVISLIQDTRSSFKELPIKDAELQKKIDSMDVQINELKRKLEVTNKQRQEKR
jgi:deoxycytidine triphosphate deaminase